MKFTLKDEMKEEKPVEISLFKGSDGAIVIQARKGAEQQCIGSFRASGELHLNRLDRDVAQRMGFLLRDNREIKTI